ncbi:MAG TPA: LysR family transcriptional regulator [Stellaceae bacterium]|nr:LysR family transcriptional regulator [Stellaceae bacterium]
MTADHDHRWEARIGRRLKLRDLHILLAVVQSGSMARAAAQLAVSPPAVSKAISDLEHTLGVRLLNRNARGVEPTTYGQAVLSRGTIAFDELKQAIRDIEFIANPNVGEVRIGCPESIAAAIIPPAMESLHRRYPGIVPIIDEVGAPTLDFSELRARKVDLVLARLVAPVVGGQSLADLNVEILFEDRIVVAVSAKSRWARRRRIDLAELADEPWILAQPDSWNTLTVAEAFRLRGLEPPRIASITLSVHIRTNLLDSGRFITILPRSVFELYARRFALKALPIDLPQRPWPVAVVTLRNRMPSPVVEVFIEHLRIVSKTLARRHAA